MSGMKGAQMRRNEMRSEPRETFASNSRDSQDFEFFFLPSFSLTTNLVPQ